MKRNFLMILCLSFVWVFLESSVWADIFSDKKMNQKFTEKEIEEDCYSDIHPEPISERTGPFENKFQQSKYIAYYTFFYVFLDHSERLYILALLSIASDDLEEAKMRLQEAVFLKPRLVDAYIQLGYIYLWEGQLNEAQKMFYKALDRCVCNPHVLDGLRKIAKKWETHPEKQEEALNIYRQLMVCRPDSFDVLFYTGRLLVWMQQKEEAEKVLLECAKLAPGDADVDLVLANLYVQEDRFDEARVLYEKHIERPEAKEGLGRIASREEYYEEAEKWYAEALATDSHNEEIQHAFCRTLVDELKFKEAKKQYKQLLRQYPGNDPAWRELFDVKLHTDPAIDSNTFYDQAKENDPTLKAPVVKDYYFNTDFIVLLPLMDRWRMDFRGFWGFQKERNIFAQPNLINYNTRISGGSLISHYFFAKNWKWDLFAKVKKAWGVGSMIYPFQPTTRFEPGTTITYNSDAQLVFLGAHIDSFVIKNFNSGTSQLLQVNTVETRIGRRSTLLFNPSIEGWYEQCFILGTQGFIESSSVATQTVLVTPGFSPNTLSNKRDREALLVEFDAPIFRKYLRVIYYFDHMHYNRVTANYYSFKQQWNNKIAGKLHAEGSARKVYAELIYERGWQKTKDLVQPIGNFIFIAAQQKLTSNKVTGLMGWRIKDLMSAELSAHYFRNTLPYRDWYVQGDLLWEF